MGREIDLTKLDKHTNKPSKTVLLDNQIIKDDVMIDKINQFSEEKYDQISSSLKINPFLPNSQTSEFQVNSIDEYYFNYKGENLNLRSMIGNKYYTNSQKRKIIKYAFNNWIKDYQKLERQTTSGIKEQVSLLDDISYKRFSIIFILLFALLMLINVALLFSSNSIYQVGFLAKLAEKIYQKMLANHTFEIITVIAVSLNFLTLSFGLFHNKMLHDSKKQYVLTKNNVNYLYGQMKHEFMSKAKQAKNYYLRVYRKKKYKSYPLTKIDMAEYSIDNVKKYAQTATIYTAKFKAVSKKLNFFRVILIFGTSGLMLMYYIYLTIVMLVQ